MVALQSLVAVALSYAPLAILAWARQRGPLSSALAALSLSAAVEAGKCFLVGTHPDPSNVLIAVAGTWLSGALLARLLAPGLVRGQEQHCATGHGQEPALQTPGAQRPSGSAMPFDLDMAQLLWVLPALIGVGWWWLDYPVARPLLAGVLLCAALSVWRHPAAALAWLPAALPVFDLAPWSGRFFFDEFDALALVCLGLAWLRTPVATVGRSRLPPLNLAVLLLAATGLGIGMARGMGAAAWPDQNAFLDYYGGYNALRLGKGILWAVLAGGLLWRLARRGNDALRPVASPTAHREAETAKAHRG